MADARDGHVRVLPLHVANKIAAGEVVERPASVVKELVENALDAGAAHVRITVSQGGRKLVEVQDDGCGMTRDDAVLSLERQATSKIRDVDDIERIDTLGFRGEALPSIASVSRFTLTTRRREEDEGTAIQVNAGTIAAVTAAGCPPGTRIEVRDLFCNVPARRKFLRAYATEEAHVRSVFTVHALAHPSVGFTLVADGREIQSLAPCADLRERVREIFGGDFIENMAPVAGEGGGIRIAGFIERPNRAMPTRRDQYVFVNGRPATAPAINYALREAYPRRAGDARPAAIVFITLPPTDVDVNVHPTKREVRFRNNVAVREALIGAIERALGTAAGALPSPASPSSVPASVPMPEAPPAAVPESPHPSSGAPCDIAPAPRTEPVFSSRPQPMPEAAPVQVEFAVEPDAPQARPWAWFRFLAATASGYLLIETDSGLVTVNPLAARERIAYEALLRVRGEVTASQPLLIPETVKLSPPDFARVTASREAIEKTGFRLEAFGADTFKIDAVPQIIGEMSPGAVITTIARDLAEGTVRRDTGGRESVIAKSVARSFAGLPIALDEKNATRLVEDLAACRMPYVCPRGKPIMIFTSTRELDRKFSK